MAEKRFVEEVARAAGHPDDDAATAPPVEDALEPDALVPWEADDAELDDDLNGGALPAGLDEPVIDARRGGA